MDEDVKCEILEDPHLRRIRLQTEAAGNPEEYEIYEASSSEAEDGMALFAVKRRGSKHIRENTPCQDHCLTARVGDYTVLADSDGVSACSQSDIGSRLACEALVKTVAAAAKTSTGEDQLVRRIHSLAFRERLVSTWAAMVMEKIKEQGLAPEETGKAFSQYGATLLYAVITPRWILTGNLGDGQVLVFNQDFGVKLRDHAPKDSSRVRCLVNAQCARQDFQVGKYPRSVFTGVLLTTDGIYESLDKGSHLHGYALQLRDRFLARTPAEPYQPFCYQEPGEAYKDFSRMRTQDDCSLALALWEGREETAYRQMEESVLAHSQGTMVKHWDRDCLHFYAKTEQGLSHVLAGPGPLHEENLQDLPLEEADLRWEEDGIAYGRYPDRGNPSLAFLQASGALRQDRELIELYPRLKALAKALGDRGYGLKGMAPHQIFYDGQDLTLRREVLRPLEPGEEAALPEEVDQMFHHLLGVLETPAGKLPIVDMGYLDRGSKRFLPGTQAPLCQPVRVGRSVHLKNISGQPWILEDGQILPGQALPLEKAVMFTIGGEETFRYREKEQL